MPNLLMDRFGPRTDCQMMLDDLTGNPREIRWILGKNVSILPKESDEFCLLLLGDMAPDGDEMRWVVPQGHLLGVALLLREPLLPGNSHLPGGVPK